MRVRSLAILLLAGTSLGACSTWKPPEIKYDDTPKQAVLTPDPPKPVEIVQLRSPCRCPASLRPIPVGRTAPPEAARSARTRGPGQWRGPRAADAGRLHQCCPDLSVLGQRALSALRRPR